MDPNEPSKSGKYLLVIIGFFSLFFILDRVFSLPSSPAEHGMDHKSKVEATRAESGHEIEVKDPEAALIKEASLDEEAEEVSKEPANKAVSGNYFENLLQNYKKDYLSDLGNGKVRTDIIIRYYRHAPDGNSAYALESLGFYIHERPVEARYAEFQSNAIFYGDSVRLEDIQIVGYTLLKEGLPIKLIKPSKFSDSWKARSIEIGTDTTLLDEPTLSLSALQSLKK
jgi:hypothetical protein